MSDPVNLNKAFKQALAAGLILCLLLIGLVGAFVLLNVDNLGRLARVVYLIESQHLDDTPSDKLVEGAIEGMVSKLDPYSSFQNADENKILMNSIKGTFGGIGVHISTADPTQLIVMRPIKGSPAERAGLQAGDVIRQIDDTLVSTISQDQAIAILRGEPGTKVRVSIFRPQSQAEISVNLIRETISVPTVEAAALPGNPDIALIGISSFTVQTGDDLAKAFHELDISRYKGFILDLRYNPGGEVNAAIKVASLLVPQGDIVHIVDNKGLVDSKQSTAQFVNKPFVVLINEYSASSSEIVAGAIKDYGTATLVGKKSFGKGVVQTVYPLDNMTSVRLTTNKYLTPKKNDIHGKGIEPDVAVALKEKEEPSIMPANTQFDTQLTKAVQVLREKL